MLDRGVKLQQRIWGSVVCGASLSKSIRKDARGGVGTTNDTAVCNAPTEGKKAAINLPCDSGQKQGGPEAEDAI